MSVLPGEGSHVILYGTTTFAVGTRTYSGYLARPDVGGVFPTALVVGSTASGAKDVCRRIARSGMVAIAFDPQHPSDTAALRRWVSAPGAEWADASRLALIVVGDAPVDAGSVEAASALVLIDGVATDTSGKPVLGLLAGDAAEPAGSVPNARMAIYGEAAAGFWDLGAEAYDEAAAEDALERLKSFLSEALAGSAAA